jgi:hypothetical protein
MEATDKKILIQIKHCRVLQWTFLHNKGTLFFSSKGPLKNYVNQK